MLDLDDPLWADLDHAFGSAFDIPDLLRQLAVAPSPKKRTDDEPWFSLWSSLCHQGDVFGASYAVVPHIVDIGCRAQGPIDFSFYQLPAAIEIARHSGNGPPIPTSIAQAYGDAVSRLTECISLHDHDDWDEATLLSVLSAQAVAKGHHGIAEVILNLDDDLIGKLLDPEFGG